MKKRIVSIFVILTLIASSAMPAFATTKQNPTGITQTIKVNKVNAVTAKITINSASPSRVQPNGVGGIIVKVLIKAMKKYRGTIINAVSKINKNWGKKFASKYDRILNILSKAKGGAESALASALRKVGFSKSNAELIADVVITAVSWLI